MNDVKDMFDRITMPENCTRKIRAAMASKLSSETVRTGYLGRSAAAVAGMLLLIFLISPEARAAMNNLVVKYFWPDSDITIYEQRAENGEVIGITAVDTEEPPFARIVNGRLYFLGNGEKIDITDAVAEDKPYYYTYQDAYGLTHYMVVGYSGELDNYGIYEFIKDETGEEGVNGWITGTGRNFMDSKTEVAYPWVAIVWEDLDIPWPQPE